MEETQSASWRHPKEKGPEDLEETTEVRVFRLALPMITKTAREVSATAMEFVLRLRADGFHIGRIHCDRGHEFEGAFKRWARSRGIYVTKTAGDDPQGNGRAEVAVKAIKSQIRRTLRQAGLDSAHWPWALRYVDELNRCVRKGIQPSCTHFTKKSESRKEHGEEEPSNQWSSVSTTCAPRQRIMGTGSKSRENLHESPSSSWRRPQSRLKKAHG